jgi:hypothetical protein
MERISIATCSPSTFRCLQSSTRLVIAASEFEGIADRYHWITYPSSS